MDDILNVIKERFNTNPHRHKDVHWEHVAPSLKGFTEELQWMEDSGGEPDVIQMGEKFYVVDFAKESPKGRRSLCYDKEARVNRKKFPPESSVLEECLKNNVKLLDEELYQYMQTIEPIDEKTSSWISTPYAIRSNGGALFMDRRYDHVFVYHNGADSYYGARGFRTYLEL